jgi:hypothetical protein
MRRLIPGLLMLGLLATACGDDTPTTPTTPNPPTTPPITEPLFTGTLRTNGAATYPFTTTAGGTITATLTTLAPDSTVGIGLSIGTWTGSACQVVIANDNAAQAAVVTGTVTSAANLCVRVYDVGRLTAPADFGVTIVHP